MMRTKLAFWCCFSRSDLASWRARRTLSLRPVEVEYDPWRSGDEVDMVLFYGFMSPSKQSVSYDINDHNTTIHTTRIWQKIQRDSRASLALLPLLSFLRTAAGWRMQRRALPFVYCQDIHNILLNS